MKQYIIPANSKKSQLIFGLFRWIDLGILGFGILLSFAFLLAIDGDGLMTMFIKFLPLLLSALKTLILSWAKGIKPSAQDWQLMSLTECIKMFTSLLKVLAKVN